MNTDITPIVANLKLLMPWVTLLSFAVFPLSYIVLCWGNKSIVTFIESIPIAFGASLFTFGLGGCGVFLGTMVWVIIKTAWTYAMTAFA